MTTCIETKRLTELERTIEEGKQTFVEVGLALAEIRDSKLYKSDFNTFEEYCRGKWGWNRAHCNQLIAGASAVKSLPPELDTIVSNQGQARELAKVEPEKREEVVTKAAEKAKSEERPMTASDIKEAASPKQNYEPGCNSEPLIDGAHRMEHQLADSESDSFFQLKRWWRKASKKDRKQFLRWIKASGGNQN